MYSEVWDSEVTTPTVLLFYEMEVTNYGPETGSLLLNIHGTSPDENVRHRDFFYNPCLTMAAAAVCTIVALHTHLNIFTIAVNFKLYSCYVEFCTLFVAVRRNSGVCLAQSFVHIYTNCSNNFT